MDEFKVKPGECCESCSEPIRAGGRVLLVAIGGGWALQCEQCTAKGFRVMDDDKDITDRCDVAIAYYRKDGAL